MMTTLMRRFLGWFLARLMPVGGGTIWDTRRPPESGS